MKNKNKFFHYKPSWLFVVIIGISMFSKYFIDTTEIAKLSSTVTLFFAMVMISIMEGHGNLRELIKKECRRKK